MARVRRVQRGTESVTALDSVSRSIRSVAPGATANGGETQMTLWMISLFGLFGFVGRPASQGCVTYRCVQETGCFYYDLDSQIAFALFGTMVRAGDPDCRTSVGPASSGWVEVSTARIPNEIALSGLDL